jgi:hypothetical protein
MTLARLRTGTVAAVSAATAVCVFATGANAATTSPAPRSHAAVQVAPSRHQGHLKAPVTGTFKTRHGTGRFTGKFVPRHFRNAHGVLKVTGKLTGKLIGPGGKKLGRVSRTITTTVQTKKAAANAPAACRVLNLVLGPLHLNLLGLNVHLNRVHLTITAIPGAGNLLGNLLCAITGLLNSGGSLNQVAALLNRVLALL